MIFESAVRSPSGTVIMYSKYSMSFASNRSIFSSQLLKSLHIGIVNKFLCSFLRIENIWCISFFEIAGGEDWSSWADYLRDFSRAWSTMMPCKRSMALHLHSGSEFFN